MKIHVNGGKMKSSVFLKKIAEFYLLIFFLYKESKDEQWKRAMDYLNVVNELNYMTQIVIMLYEDPNKVFKIDKYFQKMSSAELYIKV